MIPTKLICLPAHHSFTSFLSTCPINMSLNFHRQEGDLKIKIPGSLWSLGATSGIKYLFKKCNLLNNYSGTPDRCYPQHHSAYEKSNYAYSITEHIQKIVGELSGNPLQYSCLGDPMDRGVWWVIDHGISESNTTKWHYKGRQKLSNTLYLWTFILFLMIKL